MSLMLALAAPLPATDQAPPAGADAVPTAVPGLWFEGVEHDFGAVRQGDTVAAEFAFENRGPVPLTLSAPIAGCGCAAEIVGSADVSPGAGGRVRVTCDTARLAGPALLTATVHSSEIARRAVVLTLRGEVSLDVVAEPAEVYLGRVLRGEHKPAVFGVRAGGRGTVVRGVDSDGPYVDVAPAADGRFDVVVQSSAPLGTFTQNVVVTTTSDRFPELTVPVTGIVVERLPPRRWGTDGR